MSGANTTPFPRPRCRAISASPPSRPMWLFWMSTGSSKVPVGVVTTRPPPRTRAPLTKGSARRYPRNGARSSVVGVLLARMSFSN